VAIVNGRPFDRIVGGASTQQIAAMYHRAVAASTQPTVRGQSVAEGVIEGSTFVVETPTDRTYVLPNDPQGFPVGAEYTLPVEYGHYVEPYPAVVQERSGSTVPMPSRPSGQSAAVDDALAATVRIKVVDDTGQSFGTGTIIDSHDGEVLILTCGHIFRNTGEHATVLCDLFTKNAPQGIPGKLISHDLRRDIGLVSFRPGVPVKVIPVGGSGHRPQAGDRVFAIGCSKGAVPTVVHNRIIAVNRYHGPANLVVGGRPVDGRSGGGLFDADGTLIGVCNAADQEADEGLYAALGPIHAELDASGLSFIYHRVQPAVAAIDKQSTRHRPPPRRSSPIESALPSDSPPPDSEVIVIVRQKGGAGREGQAYVLDHPSHGLLRALSGELSRRGAHQATELQVPPVPPRSSTNSPDAVWFPLFRD
jgi:S1-C subfamily serine protease